MKNELLVMAVLASSAVLAGCSDNNAEAAFVTEDNVALTVTISDALTRISGVPSGEDSVSDLQILVFDSKGTLETYKHGTGNSISLTCTSGEKHIAAFVNYGRQVSVGNIGGLTAVTTDLADNQTGNLVMAGEKSVVLTASGNVDVSVKRVAARIGISRIENAMMLDQHRKMSFEVKAVYLVNVAGDKMFFSESEPGSWYNKTTVEEGTPSFLYDAVEDGLVASGNAYTGAHYFYSYPNHTEHDVSGGEWCARKTRLVVEASLDGTTYYYPLTLDDVESNTAYSYELKITRPGSLSPDVPVDDAVAGVTVKVEDWVELPSVFETI